MKEIKSGNFSNLRTQLFNKSACSDVVLHISDIGSSAKRVVIHANSPILYAASRYFQSCLTSLLNECNKKYITTEPGESILPNKLILRVELDFSQGLTEEVVELFFSLFYLNRFDEESELADSFHYHILELYELASFFLYDALTAYIEGYLVATMSLAYFTPLWRFCLSFDETNQRYELIESKIRLFERLLQWYECCIDPRPHTSTIEGKVCHNSEYYAHHKETILADVARRVNKIERCYLPRKQVVDQALFYYHRICGSCLDTNNRKHQRIGNFCYTDLGKLKSESETFFFRLKKKTLVNRHSPPSPRYETQPITIEMTRHRAKRVRKEEEESRYTCKSRLCLLSRKAECDVTERIYNEKDLSIPSEISSFMPHKAKHCYDGQCDQCHTSQPIYILILRVEFEKAARVQEEMDMLVEETTLCQ